jgi:chemotaxis-related protein WspB
MLFLLFQLGNDRYALEAEKIAEVLPLVDMKQLPQAPMGVAGLFNYRGTPVPAIDLSLLSLGRPASRRLSTRMVLVRYPDANGDEHLLGLVAERATEMMRREPEEFVRGGVDSDAASYLGPVVADPRGLIQWIDVASLLPADVRESLFRSAASG